MANGFVQFVKSDILSQLLWRKNRLVKIFLAFALFFQPGDNPFIFTGNIAKLAGKEGIQICDNAAVCAQQRTNLAENSKLILAANINNSRACSAILIFYKSQKISEHLLVGITFHENLVIGKKELFVVGVEAGKKAAE